MKKKKTPREPAGYAVVRVTRGSQRIKEGAGCQRKVLGLLIGTQGNEAVVRLLEDDPYDTVGWNEKGQVGRWSVSAVASTRWKRVTTQAAIVQGHWWLIDTDKAEYVRPKKDFGASPNEEEVRQTLATESPIEMKLAEGYGTRLVFSNMNATPWKFFETKDECRWYLYEELGRCLFCSGELDVDNICHQCVKNYNKEDFKLETVKILNELTPEELLEVPGLRRAVEKHYRDDIARNIYVEAVDEAIREWKYQ